MDWKQLLVYISGPVEADLLLRMEYLAAENRLLRDQVKGRLQLSDTERRTLAKIGKKLSKQALEEVATIVKPDTILAWHRKLVAQKFEALGIEGRLDGRESTRNLKSWSCGWRERIARGATTVSKEL